MAEIPEPRDAVRDIEEAVLARCRRAVEAGEADDLRALLAEHPELRRALDAPIFSFDSPAVVLAASRTDRPMLEVLLDAGADADARSAWENGPFGVLHHVCFEDRSLALWLVERGARVDVHAAAGLGDLERLTALLDAEPARLHERGPDGQLPLHLAVDVETAELLLERGAELDVPCVDHDSTAAQWSVTRAPEVSRLLLRRGARPDIFLAAAHGDLELAGRLIEEDPSCLWARLGRPGYAPVAPGNILEWDLGWWADGGRASPHRIASRRGHTVLLEALLEASPPPVRLMVAAELGDAAAARRALDRGPDLVQSLGPEDQRFLADLAWNHNVDGVRILLDVGFDPHVRGDHRSTPLDRASFHACVPILRLLLERDPNPPLEEKNEFGGTPLGALVYGCEHGWREDGDPVAGARLLAEAGAPVSRRLVDAAPPAVAEVLRPFLESSGTQGESR
ncbi:MAG: ankyrin repeat domain-containing protein [Holophagales bacterium]|nr:ankyrin repeat domain-containing protein [Holophagales bacterium]